MPDVIPQNSAVPPSGTAPTGTSSGVSAELPARTGPSVDQVVASTKAFSNPVPSSNFSTQGLPGRNAVPGASFLANESKAQASTPGADSKPGNPPVASPGHTVHVNAPLNVSAVDASGFDNFLEKHSRTVERHVNTALRNSNQRIS